MSIQATPEADQTAGVIPAAAWRIKAMSVLPDYRLAVTFQDGKQGVADFSGVLNTPCGVYEALRDKSVFEQARLELGAVTWPGGMDMDPGWMYEEMGGEKLWSVPF